MSTTIKAQHRHRLISCGRHKKQPSERNQNSRYHKLLSTRRWPNTRAHDGNNDRVLAQSRKARSRLGWRRYEHCNITQNARTGLCLVDALEKQSCAKWEILSAHSCYKHCGEAACTPHERRVQRRRPWRLQNSILQSFDMMRRLTYHHQVGLSRGPKIM